MTAKANPDSTMNPVLSHSQLTARLFLAIVLVLGLMVPMAACQKQPEAWESTALQEQLTATETVKVLYVGDDASAFLPASDGALKTQRANIWFKVPDTGFVKLTTEKDMVPVAVIGSGASADTTSTNGETKTVSLRGGFQANAAVSIPLFSLVAYDATASSGAVADPAWFDDLKAIRAAANGYDSDQNRDQAVWDPNGAATAQQRVNDLLSWDGIGDPHMYPYGVKTTAQEQGFKLTGRYGECIAFGYDTVQDVLNAWYNSPGHNAIMNKDGIVYIGIAGDPNTGIWVLLVTYAPIVRVADPTPEEPVEEFPEPEPVPVEIDTVVAPPEPPVPGDTDPADKPDLPEGIDNTDAPDVIIDVPVPVQNDGATYVPIDEDGDGAPEGYNIAEITDDVQAAIVGGDGTTQLPVILESVGDKPVTGISDEFIDEIKKSIDDATAAGNYEGAISIAKNWSAWLDTAPNQEAIGGARAVIDAARVAAEAARPAEETPPTGGGGSSGGSSGDSNPVPTTPTPDADMVTVPSVVGMTQAQAMAALQAAGMTNIFVINDWSSVVAAGLVMYQSLDGGTRAGKGDLIRLVVSQGVPSVPGSGQRNS